MEYDIRISISHRYQMSAGNGRHLVRLMPRTLVQSQWLKSFALSVDPMPSERFEGVDFFGNQTTTVVHVDAHDEMIITMSCRVEMVAPAMFLDNSPNISQLGREIADIRDLGPESPIHFLGPSPRLTANADIAAFAMDLGGADASVASIVLRIGEALHAAMTFDSTATTVDSDPGDAFRQKSGVCQDFSHIMILALRSLGIPAGYVSGYLRTLPPEGQARLEGADAMHAWVRAWCGAALGWVAYDPTNATMISTDHIVVGYGRDYSDVSPVVGHLRSAGDQENAQAVDVTLVA